MINLGSPFKLAEALREKRGTNSKTWAAKQVGVSIATYNKMENADKKYMGNANCYSQHYARLWVNNK